MRRQRRGFGRKMNAANRSGIGVLVLNEEDTGVFAWQVGADDDRPLTNLQVRKQSADQIAALIEQFGIRPENSRAQLS